MATITVKDVVRLGTLASCAAIMLISLEGIALSAEIRVSPPRPGEIAPDILNPDDGLCTLREAVIAANTNRASGPAPGECPAGEGVGGDVILLAPGTHRLSIRRAGEPGGFRPEDGDLDVRGAVTVSGAEEGPSVIRGEGTDDRLFRVGNDGDLTLERLHLTGGTAPNGYGGAIDAAGQLTVRGCRIFGNSADLLGSAIHSAGTLNISGSIIEDNRGAGDAVSIYTSSQPFTFATIEASTIRRNDGGGVFIIRGGRIVRSSLSHNGQNGIFVGGQEGVEIERSTMAGNGGDGIRSSSPNAAVAYATIADNARRGISTSNIGRVALEGSLLANNQRGACTGRIIWRDFNVADDLNREVCFSAAGSIADGVLMGPVNLGAFDEAGGVAGRAHYPLGPGSIAINRRPDQACLLPDQLGEGPVAGCDSGAVEERFCGNGIVDAGEACDDGNAVDADGCDANCTIPRCGDGILAAGEGCDDGNLVAGDGCDAVCSLEGPPGNAAGDGDGDDIPDFLDNCPAVANADQADLDANGLGDVCDAPPPAPPQGGQPPPAGAGGPAGPAPDPASGGAAPGALPPAPAPTPTPIPTADPGDTGAAPASPAPASPPSGGCSLIPRS